MLITLYIITGILLGLLLFNCLVMYYCSFRRKRLLKPPKKRLKYLMGSKTILKPNFYQRSQAAWPDPPKQKYLLVCGFCARHHFECNLKYRGELLTWCYPLFSPVYFTVDMVLLKRLSIKGMASNMDSVAS